MWLSVRLSPPSKHSVVTITKNTSFIRSESIVQKVLNNCSASELCAHLDKIGKNQGPMIQWERQTTRQSQHVTVKALILKLRCRKQRDLSVSREKRFLPGKEVWLGVKRISGSWQGERGREEGRETEVLMKTFQVEGPTGLERKHGPCRSVEVQHSMGEEEVKRIEGNFYFRISPQLYWYRIDIEHCVSSLCIG